MFKFNFNNEEEITEDKVCKEHNSDKWYKCKEISVPSNVTEIIKRVSRDQIIKFDCNCGVTINCLSVKEVMNMLKEKSDKEEFLDVLQAEKQHSDLLPGIYEGGLKTWECTKDLANYFMQQVVENTLNKLKDKSVLDLGCGSGILGIMCLMQGASVTFQDYNQEVLEAMTIPNIFLNCDESILNKIMLFSGDWLSFLELISEKLKKQKSEGNKYDYILTSETIYNPENYQKIIKIIKKLLKPNGRAFVAAKAHYFGVGGNLKEFETLLVEENMDCKTCWETTEGVSRGILEVRLKS